MLSNWRYPPGTMDDGGFDGDLLDQWTDAVKQECTETGHLNVALTMVGHVLVFAPPDPDGLWIHRSVARVLDSNKELREGFITKLYNIRGAHWVDPKGTPERELAASYRKKAEEIDSAGSAYLASSLRQLAEGYNREAEQTISREQFDE